MSTRPVALADVLAAQERIRPHLGPSPIRTYAALDEAVGHGIRVVVKHENHLPTNAFKVRNALSVLTALSAEERARGVVAATRGNHGMGVAYAGRALGVPVTICVPVGNNPEKNDAIRGYGAELIEEGADYDESVVVAQRLVRERHLRLVHSTNDPHVVAGAGTLTLELLRETADLDAMVIAVGGGSQAVGALWVARELRRGLRIYGVQAARAPAIHDAWHAERRAKSGTPAAPLGAAFADTFADGLATRNVYELTFPALCEGLAGFVTATEAELANAVRVVMRTTHNLAEGAGAAGLAGLRKLAPELAGKRVAIVISGSNIDQATLRRIVTGEI